MLARAVKSLPAPIPPLQTCSLLPTAVQAIRPITHTHTPLRLASSSSSTRWKARQTKDSYAKEAKVAGLKSRAAWKLLEINEKHHLFARGDTVVDLGYAPGSWSQVAVNRTQPGGRVVGIDVIPAQPPRGVSTIQGDFLSQAIRDEVRAFVRDPKMGRVRGREEMMMMRREEEEEVVEESKGMTLDEREGRTVDVVLSDMCEPWPLVTSTWIKSVSNPWSRMMNTSGMPFRDHAGSMVSLAVHISTPPLHALLT